MKTQIPDAKQAYTSSVKNKDDRNLEKYHQALEEANKRINHAITEGNTWTTIEIYFVGDNDLTHDFKKYYEYKGYRVRNSDRKMSEIHISWYPDY